MTFASTAEATAGTDTTKPMNAARVKEAAGPSASAGSSLRTQPSRNLVPRRVRFKPPSTEGGCDPHTQHLHPENRKRRDRERGDRLRDGLHDFRILCGWERNGKRGHRFQWNVGNVLDQGGPADGPFAFGVPACRGSGRAARLRRLAERRSRSLLVRHGRYCSFQRGELNDSESTSMTVRSTPLHGWFDKRSIERKTKLSPWNPMRGRRSFGRRSVSRTPRSLIRNPRRRRRPRRP